MGWLTWLALGGGAYYLLKLNRAGNKITITVLNIARITTGNGAVAVYINIAIDNPTGTSFTMKQPNVKLYLDGKEVGNSIPSEKMHTIHPNARTVISEVNAQIPYLNIPGALLDILTNGIKGKQIRVLTETTVNGIYYKDDKTFDV